MAALPALLPGLGVVCAGLSATLLVSLAATLVQASLLARTRSAKQAAADKALAAAATAENAFGLLFALTLPGRSGALAQTMRLAGLAVGALGALALALRQRAEPTAQRRALDVAALAALALVGAHERVTAALGAAALGLVSTCCSVLLACVPLLRDGLARPKGAVDLLFQCVLAACSCVGAARRARPRRPRALSLSLSLSRTPRTHTLPASRGRRSACCSTSPSSSSPMPSS